MLESEAAGFAQEWIATWNSHDLEQILTHYSDEVLLTSPLVEKILGDGQRFLPNQLSIEPLWWLIIRLLDRREVLCS